MTDDLKPVVYAPDDERPDARKRGDELLRRMHRTPPKPQEQMKLGKPRNRKAGKASRDKTPESQRPSSEA